MQPTQDCRPRLIVLHVAACQHDRHSRGRLAGFSSDAMSSLQAEIEAISQQDGLRFSEWMNQVKDVHPGDAVVVDLGPSTFVGTGRIGLLLALR